MIVDNQSGSCWFGLAGAGLQCPGVLRPLETTICAEASMAVRPPQEQPLELIEFVLLLEIFLFSNFHYFSYIYIVNKI